MLGKVVKRSFRYLCLVSVQSQERARQHSISANSEHRHLSRVWPQRRKRARVLLAHIARCERCDTDFSSCAAREDKCGRDDGDSDGDIDVEVDGDGDDSGDDDDDNDGDATSFRHVLDDWMVGWLGGPGWLAD